MGGLVSYFWGATEAKAVTDGDGDGDMANLDVPDKATGLTGRERKLVTETWAMVKKDVKGNGMDLFISYFTRFPEYQTRFAAFSNVPIDKLRDNKKLLAHAMSVMYAITAVVDNLNDPECLIEMLTLLGTNHQRRKIPEKAFNDLKTVLLQLLQEKLGEALSRASVAAWDKTLSVAYTVIFKGMADYEATATPGSSTSKKP